MASADQFLGYPGKVSLSVFLEEDCTRAPFVEIEIGFRTNSMQSAGGVITWDGKPLVTCHPQGPIESLRTKKILVQTMDFSFSMGTHLLEITALGDAGSTTDLFELDALVIRRVGELHLPPELGRNWLIVCGESMSVPERQNINRLKTDLSTLLAFDVPIVSATGITPEMQSEADLIVVGQYSGVVAFVEEARLLRGSTAHVVVRERVVAVAPTPSCRLGGTLRRPFRLLDVVTGESALFVDDAEVSARGEVREGRLYVAFAVVTKEHAGRPDLARFFATFRVVPSGP